MFLLHHHGWPSVPLATKVYAASAPSLRHPKAAPLSALRPPVAAWTPPAPSLGANLMTDRPCRLARGSPRQPSRTGSQLAFPV